jgi:oxygen-independent coproporphyrinogen-3 oxidase
MLDHTLVDRARVSSSHHWVDTDQGALLPLWRLLPRQKKFGQPIILAHGSFSDLRSCSALAYKLAAMGFECWFFSWQGHGQSCSPVKSRYISFDTYACDNFPAVVEAVKKIANCPSFFWLGHSGGGLSAVAGLMRHPHYQSNCMGVVTMATQASSAAMGIKSRLVIAFIACTAKVMGFVPHFFSLLGYEREPGGTMAQWCRWNLTGEWQGSDGFDYQTAMQEFSVPIFSLAAACDSIAPAEACRRFFSLLGSKDKTFVRCDRGNSFSHDYRHSTLLSYRARHDVWPQVADWISRRAESTC